MQSEQGIRNFHTDRVRLRGLHANFFKTKQVDAPVTTLERFIPGRGEFLTVRQDEWNMKEIIFRAYQRIDFNKAAILNDDINVRNSTVALLLSVLRLKL